ncbi:MAG: CAP domain-containing protein [Bacteroidales bacterium]
MYRKAKFILLTHILLFTISPLYSQKNTFGTLKEQFLQKNYETCYNEAKASRDVTNEIQMIKALSFHKLPDNHEDKKAADNPELQTLKMIRKSKDYAGTESANTQSFFNKEIKKLQQEIFEQGKKWYKQGSKRKAKTYFNALHETFDNSEDLYTNYYSFDDSYLVNHLKEQIDIPEEFYSDYKKNYDLLEKYYHNKDEFHEWNNPLYRMANTAKNEDYLSGNEKMVFYFLNLARMNPQLFHETFLNTRLKIRYHGDLNLKLPVYDTLEVSQYGETLSFDDFFELPVHKLFKQDLPQETIEKFVKTKIIKESTNATKYQYDIAYRKFYNYLDNSRPELLNLRNLSIYRETSEDREIILFKLYDKEFTVYQKEYQEEVSDHYHQSLFKTLKEMEPKSILQPDKELFNLAECWAIEAGQRKLKGHDRVNCSYGYDAECNDYGNKNGLDIVLSLLIDRYVPDLGHRKVLLGNFSEMGVAIRPHKSSFDYNAVLDFYR